MPERVPEGARVVFLAVIIISVISAPVVATAAFTSDVSDDGVDTENAQIGPDPLSIDSNETLELSENVSTWNRAMLPLRVDMSATQINVTAPITTVVVEEEGVESSLHREHLGVFSKNEEIPLTFDPARANGLGSDFEGQSVELIAARLTEDESNLSIPQSAGEIDDLLVNDQNVSFEHVASTELDSTNGTGTFTYETNTSGHYVFFLAAPETSGSSFDVEDGNISVDGEMTVIGMDAVSVRNVPAQSQTPTVPPNRFRDMNVERGDSASFTFTAPDLGEENVEHAIVLYDRDTFVSQQFTVNYTGELSADASITNNTTIETTVGAINGEAVAEDEFTFAGKTVGGTDTGDGQATGVTDMGSIVAFVFQTADREQSPHVAVDDDNVTLDASAVAKKSGARVNFDVQTYENFSTGTYQWVYVASEPNGTNVTAATGTIEVVDEAPGDGGPGGGGGPPEDPGQGDGRDRGQGGGPPSAMDSRLLGSVR